MSDYEIRASKIMSRINELATITEQQGVLTRTYGSGAAVEAAKKVAAWMEAAGLETRIDNIGNVRGRLSAANGNIQTFIIASHIDTVVNAGKFDGPLGVLMGLDLIEHCITGKTELPFTIELIAFADEEGVRFHTTYLGSKVAGGLFQAGLLSKTDKDGITLKEALQKIGGNEMLLAEDAVKGPVVGYFEIHIEQGPVLYNSNDPVAVVTAIAGQKRLEVIFTGDAGHAGTVPMDMRRDALCCAAACIGAVEAYALDNAGIVATVGKLDMSNAASNVIPGLVTCTLDIRSADEAKLSITCTALQKIFSGISERRNISMQWNLVQDTAPVSCDAMLGNLLKQSIKTAGSNVVQLVSGAGHDAVPLSAICPVSMMFVRCFKGISHNPLEDVETKDIAAAIKVADNFILLLASHFNQ